MAEKKEIGLAVVGGGVVGRIRALLARDFPGVAWLGVADVNEKIGRKLAEDCQADFFTTDFRELLSRSEVNATIIATPTFQHFEPTMAAIERGHKLFIEKPLATDARESEKIAKEIKDAGIDAVTGYTQRFRRRFIVVKQKVESGQIGDVTAAVTRAFMNRMAPTGELRNATMEQKRFMTPMVISGTHSLDIGMWVLGSAKPVSIYARSSDKILGGMGTKDATFGIWTMADGAIWSMNISWALPAIWPGSVYGLEVGIVGTKGVVDIEDTHRDVVLASEFPQGPGYNPEGLKIEATRNVDFLTSFPPGDMYMDELWGPMRDETNTWFQRIYNNKRTPHATAEDGHRNLMMTMAMDLSARRGKEIAYPVSAEELMEA
jgi:myo-inositol 2-dehydrogenase / D-chiro-inositol 1-dehydrogenase